MNLSATVADRGSSARRTPLTREKVIERVRRWATLYGEPPGTADWNPSVARWRAQEWRIGRYRLGDPETGEPWPSTTAAKRRFGGSWDAAVRAAGFEPRRPGPRPAGVPAGRSTALGVSANSRGPAGAAGAVARASAPAESPHGSAGADTSAAGAGRSTGASAESPCGSAGADGARRLIGGAAGAVGAAAEVRAVDGGLAASVRGQGRPVGLEDRELRRLESAQERAAGARRRARGLAEQVRRAQAARDREAARRVDAEREAAALRAELAAIRAAAAVTTASPATGRRDPGTRRSPAAPAGPAVLAEALGALAAARRAGDPVRLGAALTAVAAASDGWRARL